MATATIQQGEVNLRVLKGPPYMAILRLAMPTVFAMLFQSAVNEIDVVFFSRLPYPESSNAQAALLPSLILVWLFGGSLSAISVGTQALVGRRYAERNYEAAGRVLANSAWFCLVAGIVFSLIGALTIKKLVAVMIPGNPEAQQIAYEYSRFRLVGVVSMSMTMAVKAFFDGISKTYVHFVASLLMNVCNVFLCYTLIFGHFGAPRMGAPGAGLAALIATWIGLFIMLGFAWNERRRYMPVRWSNISRSLTWDILQLSIPAGFATIVMMVGFGMFSSVAGRLDKAALHGMDASAMAEAVNGAATTNIVALMKLTFTACIAFGTATATLVAQSLGAKLPEEAQKFGWASVRLGLVIFGIVGLCEGVLFTPQIVGVISHSDAVREAMMSPMRMMGVLTPIIAVAMILTEALFGAGTPQFVAIAQFVLVFFVLVPLAWILALVVNHGLMGMWTGAAVYICTAAVVMVTKFRLGDWKTIKL
jgi:putative MATE family efflux protein